MAVQSYTTAKYKGIIVADPRWFPIPLVQCTYLVLTASSDNDKPFFQALGKNSRTGIYNGRIKNTTMTSME